MTAAEIAADNTSITAQCRTDFSRGYDGWLSLPTSTKEKVRQCQQMANQMPHINVRNRNSSCKEH
jgi:hypothetical protein